MARHHEEPPKAFGGFDFDLARAVLTQLVESFDALTVGPLNAAALQHMISRGQGVYQLYLNGQLRYVGKANNLPKRLSRHFRELSARQNLDVTALGFKALYIHRNWTTWTTEEAMIRYFGDVCQWNASGFGSNDPGHNREDTAEDDTFNNLYPINPDIPCTWIGPGPMTAWDVLNALKDRDKLPYLLRFHRVNTRRQRAADVEAQNHLKETNVIIPRANMTVRELLIETTKQLGPGWQATQFKGRLIVYKEHQDYRYGTVLHRT